LEQSVEIREEKHPSATILVPTGRLDSNTSGEFGTRASRVIAAGVAALVVDFSGVAYISSAGLRVLLQAAKSLKTCGRKIVLCGLQKNVMTVFDASGFTSLFEIYDTQNAAVAAVS
jgi:anti-sigma B factor antagonist